MGLIRFWALLNVYFYSITLWLFFSDSESFLQRTYTDINVYIVISKLIMMCYIYLSYDILYKLKSNWGLYSDFMFFFSMFLYQHQELLYHLSLILIRSIFPPLLQFLRHPCSVHLFYSLFPFLSLCIHSNYPPSFAIPHIIPILLFPPPQVFLMVFMSAPQFLSYPYFNSANLSKLLGGHYSLLLEQFNHQPQPQTPSSLDSYHFLSVDYSCSASLSIL